MKKSIIYFISFIFISACLSATKSSFTKLPSPIEGVEYISNSNNSAIYLRNDGISLVTKRTAYQPNPHNKNVNSVPIVEMHRIDLDFVNANPNLRIEPLELFPTKRYVIENGDRKQLFNTSEFLIRNIYEGIDFRGYFTENDEFEFDFIINPNADANNIKLSINHSTSQSLTEDEKLQLGTNFDYIILDHPYTYQLISNRKEEINSNYKLEGNILSFTIGNYDKSKTLIIDPITRFMGSYFGGNGNDTGYDIDEDSQGNYYITGFTESVTKIAKAGYQMMHGGLEDAYLSKFDADDNLVWSTYFGSHNFEVSYALNIDNTDNIVIVGETNSIQNIATINSHQNSYGGGAVDGFIAKFGTSGQLEWATYFGGTGDDKVNDVVIDEFGNVYITGFTTSSNNIYYNGYQQLIGGENDAFIAKFNPIGILQWCTYYGGGFDDFGNGIAIDGNRNVYVVGSTQSATGIAYKPYIPQLKGKTDAFACSFTTDGQIRWGTYFGGDEDDIGKSVAIDGDFMYFVGDTKSPSFISLNGFQNLPGGGWDGFVAKFDLVLSPYWSTYYGGTGDDFLNKIEISESAIYTVGSTNSSSQISLLGWQPVFSGGSSDGTFAKYKPSNELEWSTYYGGTGRDVLRSVSVDQKMYVAGFTNSDDGINQEGYQTTRSSQLDAMFGEMSESELLLLINEDEFCAGNEYTFSIDYVNLEFKQDNKFIVEVSDEKGSFDNPEFVGEVSATGMTDINVRIPEFLPYSKKYKFRLTSTSPKYKGRTLLDSATIYPRPIIDWSADPLCVNNSRIFSTDRIENVNYRWEYESGQKLDSNDTFIKLRWSEDGKYKVRLIAENPVCIDTAFVNVTVSPLPSSEISGPINTCGNSIVNYTAAKTEHYVFEWKAQEGAILSQSKDGSALVLWNNIDATGKLILTVQDTITGCTSIEEMQVVIEKAPIATISGTDTTCRNCTEIFFTDDAGTSIWEVVGGSVLDQSNTEITIKTDAQADSIVIKLIKSQESNDCKDSITKIVYLTDSPVTSITGLKKVCEFEEYSYFTSSNNELTNEWSVVGGEITKNNGNNIIVRWGQRGEGNIKLIQKSKDNSYEDSVSNIITINPKPNEFSHNIPTEICLGDSLTFEFLLQESETVKITHNATNYSNGEKYIFETVGENNFDYEISNSFGCKQKWSTKVNVLPKPSKTTLLLEDGVIYSDKTGKHKWYLDGEIIAGEEGSSLTPKGEGTYTAEYLDGSCWSELSDDLDYSLSNIVEFGGSGISIYPIPANERLVIKSEKVISRLSIVDLIGNEIMNFEEVSDKEIDISAINSGIYFVKIWLNDKLLTKKIIIK